jgi:TorA maturation chaperone TorD
MNAELDIIVDEFGRARAQEYALLATLLARNPDVDMLQRLALLTGDDSPLGLAHAALGAAAASASVETVRQEYFDLFAGLGESGLMPYASFYLAGSLYGRPLERLRDALKSLGIEKVSQSEPEDHVSIVCEIMSGVASGALQAPAGADREFFKIHVVSWIRSFFVDLEKSGATSFYAHVGTLGRVFIDIETEAYALAD